MARYPFAFLRDGKKNLRAIGLGNRLLPSCLDGAKVLFSQAVHSPPVFRGRVLGAKTYLELMVKVQVVYSP